MTRTPIATWLMICIPMLMRMPMRMFGGWGGVLRRVLGNALAWYGFTNKGPEVKMLPNLICPSGDAYSTMFNDHQTYHSYGHESRNTPTATVRKLFCPHEWTMVSQSLWILTIRLSLGFLFTSWPVSRWIAARPHLNIYRQREFRPSWNKITLRSLQSWLKESGLRSSPSIQVFRPHPRRVIPYGMTIGKLRVCSEVKYNALSKSVMLRSTIGISRSGASLMKVLKTTLLMQTWSVWSANLKNWTTTNGLR